MARNGLRLEFDQRAHSDKPACVFRQGSEALPGIPPNMIDAVLRCDTKKGRPRPAWLSTQDALELTQGLLNEEVH